MTITTARHKLPLLAPGQAQKEMYHNESLSAIDMLLHAAVEAVGVDAPPPEPDEGQSWIVGASPGGEWARRAHSVASWTEGGWRFQDAVPGLSVCVRASGLRAEWDGATWRVGEVNAAKLMINGVQVIGERRPAIVNPAGGTAVDAETRAAVTAMLETMRAHGLIA